MQKGGVCDVQAIRQEADAMLADFDWLEELPHTYCWWWLRVISLLSVMWIHNYTLLSARLGGFLPTCGIIWM